MDSEDSDKLKSMGNQSFSKGNYSEAIMFYSKAIEVNSSNPILYSNRSIAYLKLKNYFAAEKDCDHAIQLDNSFDKAFFRRGLARKELKRFKSSFNDFEKALELAPNNKDIKKEYDCLKQLLTSLPKIKIDSIQKDENYKSKEPLKTVFIKNEDETKTEISPILKEKVIKDIKNRIPKNYNEFENNWRELHCIEDRVEYMQKIDFPTYSSIFKYPFEPKLLKDVISTLSHCSNVIFVYHLLQSITKMTRFDLSVCFFSDEEYEALNRIFDKFKYSDCIKKDDILSLAHLFKINTN